MTPDEIELAHTIPIGDSIPPEDDAALICDESGTWVWVPIEASRAFTAGEIGQQEYTNRTLIETAARNMAGQSMFDLPTCREFARQAMAEHRIERTRTMTEPGPIGPNRHERRRDKAKRRDHA